MSNAQTSELSEGAAASNASSSSCKSSADWQKYYDLLVRRRDLALKPGNKSHSAAWWNFFISRAEKMVFVSSAAKVANRDLKSAEEAELQLLCSAVDEESFGTAMVDCVLISESS